MVSKIRLVLLFGSICQHFTFFNFFLEMATFFTCVSLLEIPLFNTFEM